VILTGVVVVGDASYSADGRWLAFSARPIDGSTGPDLYLWRVGDPVASAVTADHRTFFAGWLGNQVLASRVEQVDTTVLLQSAVASGLPAANQTPTPTPDPTATPTPDPTATPKPGRPKPDRTPNPAGPQPSEPPSAPPSAPLSPAASPASSPTSGHAPATEPAGNPEASPLATLAPAEDHAVSFLLDPATGTVTALAQPDIWRPVVDPTSRAIVYWSGTLVRDETGTGWDLGTGRLVLDRWIDPAMILAATPDPNSTPDPNTTPDPNATPAPTATPLPTATPAAMASPGASIDPLAGPTPPPQPGPAGSPVVLAEGPIADFEASFDPSGTRLAVWIRDPENVDIGTLRLIPLDSVTGSVDTFVDPLPGVAALRGFSIAEGRLAWVTPPGQDGEASHLQVLAWTGSEFGQAAGTAVEGLRVVR